MPKDYSIYTGERPRPRNLKEVYERAYEDPDETIRMANKEKEFDPYYGREHEDYKGGGGERKSVSSENKESEGGGGWLEDAIDSTLSKAEEAARGGPVGSIASAGIDMLVAPPMDSALNWLYNAVGLNPNHPNRLQERAQGKMQGALEPIRSTIEGGKKAVRGALESTGTPIPQPVESDPRPPQNLVSGGGDTEIPEGGIGEQPSVAAPVSGAQPTYAPPSSGALTRENYPSVSNKEQNIRDTKRFDILNNELAKEKALLAKAQDEGRKEDIVLHERNIVALNKEINNTATTGSLPTKTAPTTTTTTAPAAGSLPQKETQVAQEGQPSPEKMAELDKDATELRDKIPMRVPPSGDELQDKIDSLGLMFEERMNNVQRVQYNQMDFEQKRMVALRFFLSLMEHGGKRGSEGFLSNVGKAGREALDAKRVITEQNNKNEEARYDRDMQRIDAHMTVGFKKLALEVNQKRWEAQLKKLRGKDKVKAYDSKDNMIIVDLDEPSQSLRVMIDGKPVKKNSKEANMTEFEKFEKWDAMPDDEKKRMLKFMGKGKAEKDPYAPLTFQEAEDMANKRREADIEAQGEYSDNPKVIRDHSEYVKDVRKDQSTYQRKMAHDALMAKLTPEQRAQVKEIKAIYNQNVAQPHTPEQRSKWEKEAKAKIKKITDTVK
jgi:hypothetical protein